MALFLEQDIQDECGHNAFIRGRKYFKEGRVNRMSSSGNHVFLELTGIVSGSKDYRQTIKVTQKDVLDIFGHCSCPVGFNCKHVVAVLFYYLDATQQRYNANHQIRKPNKKRNLLEEQTQQLNQWFYNVSNIEPVELESELPKNNKFLAYILNETTQPGEIKVDFVKTGFKKKGGFYKAQRIEFDNLPDLTSYYSTAEYLTELDRVIISLFNSQRKAYYFSYEPVILNGAIGHQVIEKLLLSQRCFWSELSNDNLLIEGGDLELGYQWQAVKKTKNSAMKLKSILSPTIQTIAVEPPCYIDTETMKVGALLTSLSGEQLKLFNQMPEVPQKLLENVSLKLVTENLDQNIPLPVDINVRYLDGENISPQVLLTKLTLEKGNTVHALKVSYFYDNFEINIMDDTAIFVKQADQYLKINRDLAKEQAYFDRLVDFGFEGIRYGDNQIGLIASNNMTHGKSQQEQLKLWKTFTEESTKTLIDEGWRVKYEDDFNLHFIQAEEDWDLEVEDDNDWFSLKFDLNLVNGKKIPLIPLVSPLLKDYGLDDIPDELLVETETGQYVSLKKNKVLPILKLLYELFDTPPSSQNSIKISKFDALQVEQLSHNEAIGINWLGSEKLQALAKKLAGFKGLKNIAPSKKFNGELREYQQQGFNWLQFLRDFEFGGLLADDMGLGKTVQTLIHLQKEKMAKRMTSPCLIVAPTSLMSNWKRESEKFTPNLKVLILQGSDRHEKFSSIKKYDLILTTYPLIVRDYAILSSHSFYAIVLDEAQNIKNPKSKATQLLKSFKTKHKLALTGTPMENHLGELWSIFDFLIPGFLGNETSFRRKYRTPIEKHGNIQLAKMLSKRVQPFLLRRTKEVVAKELPPKTVIIKSASMSQSQATLYETIRIAMEKKIEQALATKGLNRSHITILDALLKLRQVCCDPQLLKLPQAKKIKESAKLELLMTMLPELIEEGRKVLLFSQFTSMLKLIEEQLKDKKIEYSKLTGSTKNREKVIEKFTSGEVPLFLISLKAGGVGLNLTEADTVIHYDPWWNPAVENQASDRAHRIGQDKPVFVYKLIVENTLEEKILEMQERKQALADGVYGKSKGEKQSALTKEDISELLANHSGS